jgi:hypothetical protein
MLFDLLYASIPAALRKRFGLIGAATYRRESTLYLYLIVDRKPLRFPLGLIALQRLKNCQFVGIGNKTVRLHGRQLCKGDTMANVSHP